jgi:hypothetical protein
VATWFFTEILEFTSFTENLGGQGKLPVSRCSPGAVSMAVKFAAIHLARLQRRQFAIHSLQLRLQLSLQFGDGLLLLAGIGQHLLQALAQVARLPRLK